MGALDKHIYYDRINQEVNIGDVVAYSRNGQSSDLYFGIIKGLGLRMAHLGESSSYERSKSYNKLLVLSKEQGDTVKQMKGWED